MTSNPSPSPRGYRPRQDRGPTRRPAAWRLFAALALSAVSLGAVERKLTITAPATAVPGELITISALASTDAGGGEKIGFFHADYSTDGGKTWKIICYEQDLGQSATRNASFAAGPADSTAVVRVRVAFRGGAAGDVDFGGRAIEWPGAWNKWSAPPAKFARIPVAAKQVGAGR